MPYTKNAWVTCWECRGLRFDEDNRLCKMCGGDGCIHKSTIIKLLDGHAPDTLLADITSNEGKVISDLSSSSSGIGFGGLLTVALIVLKLCDVIAWSWWWVLSPLWIAVTAAMIIVLVVFVVAILSEGK